MRVLLILMIITLGLPVACIDTCGGGGGPSINYEMINQSIENTKVDVFQETSSIQLSFSIIYEDQQVAMMQNQKGSFGSAFACSPPPNYYVNAIAGISIISNKDLYGRASGEELNALFRLSNYGENEPLSFPIQLQTYESIRLTMIGSIPDNQDHTFTIKSETSDNKEFVSKLSVSFQ